MWPFNNKDISDRERMSEKEYLTLENEFKKEQWIRKIQGWFVACLLAILLVSLFIVMGTGVQVISAAEVKLSTGIAKIQKEIDALKVKPDSGTDAVILKKITELQSQVSVLIQEKEKMAQEREKCNSESQGWARTTVTAIIGFITGFISARRSPGNPEGGDKPLGEAVGRGGAAANPKPAGGSEQKTDPPGTPA